MPVPAGDGKVADATMTRMQELGSAWIFKRAIQDNAAVRWTSADSIRNDKDTFKEIVKIWKEAGKVNWVDNVDMPWLINFYKQQEELIQKIGRPKFTLFTRDGKTKDAQQFPWQIEDGPETFMEWVSKLLSKEFKIGQKDNWNPADIWLIQDEKKWKDKIKAVYAKRKDPTKSIEVELAKFNAILELFLDQDK